MKRIIIASAIALTLAAALCTGCQKNENTDAIPISSLSVPKTKTVQPNTQTALEVTVTPENATEKPDYVWNSSDPTVATVDEAGKISVLKVGETVITVALRNRTSVKAQCTVTASDGIEEYEPDMVVPFEDSKFQALTLYYDKNNDGKLQAWEAALVTELNVNCESIVSLRGIEFFKNLEKLDCGRNALTALDVSKNLKLRELLCYSNTIASLDVSMLANLQVLNCRGNHLSAIDVTKNAGLVEFYCGMNNGSMYEGDGITSVDVSQNAKLERLDVYYLNIGRLDVTHNTKLKWLDMGYCCHTRWNDLTPIEEIDLSQNPDLEYFNCTSSNYPGFGLNKLDVSRNPKLKNLGTYGNPKLGKLDVSHNPELSSLNCCHNSLTELDVTKCPLLDTLYCAYNSIGKLDLKQNKELTWLNCQDNQIDGLDISATKMGYLMAPNNLIAAIDMGDKTFDTPSASGTGYDDAGLPYLYINLNSNKIESIDLSKQKYLYWIEISGNRLASLDVTGCSKLGGVYCNNNRITSLKTDGCARMWELHFAGNALSGSLDLSALSLNRISAGGNQLETIYVPKGFKADDTYYLGGTGTMPCYTKDASTNWVEK